ncbi:MAG: hypothetical protein ACOYLO_16455, partial [Ferruginibacter sp.]
MKNLKKRLIQILIFIVLFYGLLLIPDFEKKEPITQSDTKPFFWNNDTLWNRLENDFRKAKTLPRNKLDSAILILKSEALSKYLYLQNKKLVYTDSNLVVIQNVFFSLAPLIAVNQSELNWYTGYYNQVRNLVKLQSQHWNMQELAVRDKVYSLLYGMRAATEEVLLQSDSKSFSPGMLVKEEVSVTPAASIFGIEVHSGDLLVSRGGAEVSALISRGNDYPGNFSHVALLYCDKKTNQPFLIESHI